MKRKLSPASFIAGQLRELADGDDALGGGCYDLHRVGRCPNGAEEFEVVASDFEGEDDDGGPRTKKRAFIVSVREKGAS